MTASRAKSATSERDQLMDTKQVSEYLQVPEETVKRWRKQVPVVGPPYIKVGGRHVRYDPVQLAKWVEQQTVGAA